MYNNLLYFLVVIFLFSMKTVPEAPLLPPVVAASCFVISLIGYGRLARFLYRKAGHREAHAYFRAERQALIQAVLFFGLAAYLCDFKYYLSLMGWAGVLPAAVNIAGLGLFFCYLALMWRVARPQYQHHFGGNYTLAAFITMNIRVNLPIVLPWALLSLCHDLVTLIPWPGLQELVRTAWGDFFFYIFFLLFVLLIFPPVVRRLWGCVRMPAGALRDQLTAFCARQKFATKLYLWPLYEGHALTAGVMGIVPGLRYVLITPGLIQALTIEELEAVMAHEIGHVKKRHLLLYLLLIAGFSLVVGALSEPLTYVLLSRDFFYSLMRWSGMSPEAALVACTAVPLLAVMLLYFRFLFGYFIRNFERQADLHVFAAFADNQYAGRGRSHTLVSAFEKIGLLSGNRDQPSWHHFGIGERVAFLEKCERDPGERDRHERKVRLSLAAYLLALTVILLLARQIPMEGLVRQYEEKYIETVLWQKIQHEEDKALWLRLAGDLMQHKKMEQKALEAYEKALTFEPVSPDLMNNLAWLLLTGKDEQLRDPKRALSLARTAVIEKPVGSFLDTLALAYWANGFREEAIRAEEEAILADPDGREYYRQQIERFRKTRYQTPNQPGPEVNPGKTEEK
jgi:Zn-dependent protease with chaperone function